MRLIDADALIFELEEWKKNPNNDDSAVDLVNHFIGIIRATPSAEPSGDLISRADAVKEIHKYFVKEIDKTPTKVDEDGDEVYTDMATVNSLLVCNKEISKAIKALPSADRPQGEWIDWLGCGNEWECSICKCSIESHGSIAYNYCPMCGARMESK